MTTSTELRALLAEAMDSMEHEDGCAAQYDPAKPCGCGYIKLCRRITAALSGKDEGGWLPIETAPKDGAKVLLLSNRDGICLGRWETIKYKIWEKVDEETQKATGENDYSGWYGSDGNGTEICEVTLTHWQPLPPLPKGDIK